MNETGLIHKTGRPLFYPDEIPVTELRAWASGHKLDFSVIFLEKSLDCDVCVI
jgi:hypothetical protein